MMTYLKICLDNSKSVHDNEENFSNFWDWLEKDAQF